ncbi:hypothetical protein [Legionella parisiensis]|uniref:Uncharacterized protein n=1 Tax=Legionella parisiensis TaxID=45071 RepID=A0A1E5JU53_9GAMM|nr:hypothetical protein [Legionella parisiensis]KTD43120.1 hypothetical protein Lpar_1097 [Legionella parisiensis]OEH48000.1 hypothetical protein lpari_01024 [Legionella parisiensis]STX77801.1 Uncharacterised protein [Legionella parisiensis]
MSLAKIYAEEAKDFEHRVEKISKNAKTILAKYPHDFDEELVSFAVRSILRYNDIDAYEEISDSQWAVVLNEKTLFNAILAYYFSALDEQLFRQSNWLHKNDVPTEKQDINIRTKFLGELSRIREKKFEGHSIEEAIQFKLAQAKELSDVITKTDIEHLKDHHTLNILEVISSILKLFSMSVFCPLYFDPIISNKSHMGNAFSTLWSGKSLNTIHMEHLKAKSEQLEHACNVVSEALATSPEGTSLMPEPK